MIAKEKILLVEDKKSRFERQSPPKIEDYVTIMTDLPGYKVGQVYDFTNLDNYKLIILHNSILADKGLSNSFTQYAIKSDSFFILFSGNFSIPQIIYGGKVLKVPVNLFYSNELSNKIQALNEDEDSLMLHFLYGENFRKAIAHNEKQRRWLTPEKSQEKGAQCIEGKVFSGKQDEKTKEEQENAQNDNQIKNRIKVLVLQNDTLPSLPEDSNKIFENRCIDVENVNVKPDDENKDYDTFLSEFLGEYVFNGDSYDLIVMSVSFDNDNSLNCEGIRIACHIRLTQQWNNTHTPILFFTSDSLEELLPFAPYPSIFATSHIYLSKANNLTDMAEEMIVANKKGKMSDAQYYDFLSKVKIDRPSNHKTHHSIANEWTLMQWFNMIDWKGNRPEIENSDFLNRLHTKYMIQTLKCHPKDYATSDKLPMKINGIDNKTIMLIDDEYNKGWKAILSRIINASNAHLVCFEDFNKTLSRDDQINKINNFIDAYHNPIDCYIIDLRLHDEDVEETDSSKLSGHRITDHIVNDETHGNRGRQVVILTASNKVWNMRKEIEECGARYYALKESPEMQLTHEQSKNLFLDFCKDIQMACQQSYIARYQKFIHDNATTINAYIDVLLSLLVSDRSIEKVKLIPSMLLAEVATIEKYVTGHYELSGGDFKEIGSSLSIPLTSTIQFQYDPTDSRNPINLKFIKTTPAGWEVAKTAKGSTLTLIIAYLHHIIHRNDSICKLFLTARKERNTHIAHNGGTVSLGIDDVKSIFEEIIMKINW